MFDIQAPNVPPDTVVYKACFYSSLQTKQDVYIDYL